MGTAHDIERKKEMENGKIRFVREYENNGKQFDIIYHSRTVLFVHEEDLPVTVRKFIASAKRITKQYDHTSTRKNKNEIIYEA